LQVNGREEFPGTRIVGLLFDPGRQEVHCFGEPSLVQELLGLCQSIFALAGEASA
jgi:hypothetical protein